MKRLPTRYQELEDISVAYTEYGEGKPLLLLHGNSETKSIFYKYQTEYFSDYHTYALDSRGHGETKNTCEDLSIKQISIDVIKFCRTKGISNAKVIGYSDGGNISLFLAANASDIFDHIVAISPNYLVSGTVEKWLKVITAFYNVFKFIGAKQQQQRFELMLKDIGLSREEMNGIKTNLEVLYASNDMIKEEHIIEIHKNIPGSKLKKITPSSHLTIFENKEAIEEMREYLK